MSHFYSEYFSDYSPGYLYILSFLGFIKSQLVIQNNIYFVFLKMPSVLDEVILAFIIYIDLKRETNKKNAVVGLSFILFNPAFIFNSSVWGQIDGFLTLFLYLALRYLIKGNYFISTGFLALSILVKPQALILFPVFIIFWARHIPVRKIIELILFFIAISFTFSFPFFPQQPLTGLISQIIKPLGEFRYVSVSAFNLWGILGYQTLDSTKFFFLSLQSWGMLFFVAYLALLSLLYFKKKLSVVGFAALIFLGFFYIPTEIHERYLYPGLVFLIVTAIATKSKKLAVCSLLLSIINVLNLYNVYENHYYGIYQKSLIRGLSSFDYLLNSGNKAFSLLSFIIFLSVIYYILKGDQNVFKPSFSTKKLKPARNHKQF